ncbi:hypothetical protein V1477_000626 [Vespula maculifrons]|uniref:Uncharacterized protein n=1 Tax=Vespula maculifrons TaxID=7453 RepID=A0ABD2D256_VESMC
MDIEKKRKEKMNLTKVGIRKSCWIFSSRRRRPAQKPTPMSPTHGTHPRESIIINFGKVFEACSHSLGNTCIAGDFDVTQVFPTQVPPRGGSCIWGPTG